MSDLRIQTETSRFRPGQAIQGSVSGMTGRVQAGDTHLAIRLIWYTTGKGTRDFEVVAEQQRNCNEEASHEVSFEFIAPHRPLSFDGALIGLQWAIEAICFPSQASVRHDLVISNTPRPIQLESLHEELKASGFQAAWFPLQRS